MRTQTSKEISKREGVWDALLRRVLVPVGAIFEGGEFLLLIIFAVLYYLGQ